MGHPYRLLLRVLNCLGMALVGDYDLKHDLFAVLCLSDLVDCEAPL